MIKEPKNMQSLKLNVFLKNGTSYLNKDTTPKPFGEMERVVGFWDEDMIIMIPMEQVYRVELVF